MKAIIISGSRNPKGHTEHGSVMMPAATGKGGGTP